MWYSLKSKIVTVFRSRLSLVHFPSYSTNYVLIKQKLVFGQTKLTDLCSRIFKSENKIEM